MKFKTGDKIRIINMEGEPRYAGKEGIIKSIGKDAWGNTYFSGTWGGCNVYPSKDDIEYAEAYKSVVLNVEICSDGIVYISHDGSSGVEYEASTANEIGRAVTDYVRNMRR